MAENGDMRRGRKMRHGDNLVCRKGDGRRQTRGPRFRFLGVVVESLHKGVPTRFSWSRPLARSRSRSGSAVWPGLSDG